MEIYIFNKDLNPLGVVDTFYSLSWIRRYHETGRFELHLALTHKNLDLFEIGNIIYKPGNDEAGVIDYRNLSQDVEGHETLVLTGSFATGYLDRRIIWGQEIINGTAENAMRTLVTKHAINPTNTDRKIPNLILGEVKGYTERIDYQISYANLLEELQGISKLSGIGFKTVLDIHAEKFVFELYKGLDRTIYQATNSPAIFSNEYENVFEQEYVNSIDNYRNIVLIAGEGEGTDRKSAVIGTGLGLDRYELYIDARDLRQEDEDGNPITDADYLAMLKDRGQIKLQEYKKLETFESTINVTHGNLKYKEDFDLGDIVTVMNKNWNVLVNPRITEIKEIYEPGKSEVYVTFGDKVPTLIDKIKRETKR